MKKTMMLLAAVALTATACTSPPPDEPTIPDVCLEALDAADQMVDAFVESNDIFIGMLEGPITGGMEAAYAHDGPGMRRAADQIDGFNQQIVDLTGRVEAIGYQDAAAKCRAEVGR